MRRKPNRQKKEKRFESVSPQLRERPLEDRIPAKKTTIDGFTISLPTKRTRKSLNRTKVGRRFRTRKLMVEEPVTIGLEPTENAGESLLIIH